MRKRSKFPKNITKAPESPNANAAAAAAATAATATEPAATAAAAATEPAATATAAAATTAAATAAATATEPAIPRKRIYLALSFFLPFCVMGTVFVLHGVYPFGDRQILVGFDSLNQYYPFFSEFWHRMRSGSSLLWSWTGGGIDYLGLYAYYLSSPLNFLVVPFPHEWLREVMAVLVLIKLGLSGLFMAMFLRGVFQRCDMSLPAFSLLYALCALVATYYWHIMWLDSIALLPLVMLGVRSLVRDGKYRLFAISLALSVYCNYFFGIYICIFVAIMFFCQCFVNKLTFKQFFRKLGKIAAFSAIALGMVSLLLVPALSNMLKTVNAAQDSFPAALALYNSFSDVLGNMIAFTHPTEMRQQDLPILYSGMLALVLMPAFFCLPQIKTREKIAYAAVAAFILVSSNVNVLNQIWNGFYFTVGIRSRFTFLYSFMIIVMAYRAFTVIASETLKKKHVLISSAIMLPTIALVLLMALKGPQENNYVIGSAVLCAIYIAAWFVYAKGAPGFRRAASVAVLAVLLFEISATAYLSVGAMGLTSRDGYPDLYSRSQLLLDRRGGGAGFYRTEFSQEITANDPHLYNYDGVSFYSSTANNAVTDYYMSLGMSGRVGGKRHTYTSFSPLVDAFSSIRYLVAHEKDSPGYDFFWEQAAEADGSLLLENNYCLPLGFMADNELSGFSPPIVLPIGANPFRNQNDLFRRATGLEGDLFTLLGTGVEDHIGYATQRRVWHDGSFVFLGFAKTGDEDVGRLMWNYQIPQDGMHYAYVISTSHTHLLYALVNGRPVNRMSLHQMSVLPLGYLKSGDELSLFNPIAAPTGNINIHVARIDEALFIEGYELLNSATLALTERSDTRITGRVSAAKDGLLYTSIPYEGDNWKAYVDGIETKILPIGGAMSAIRLSAGEHIVEFRYHNVYATAGLAVCLVSVIALIVCSLATSRRAKRSRAG